MPLTDYQQGLALLLAENRSFDSYLAGGAAILIEPNTMRFSRDLDYFHDSEARVSEAFSVDQRLLLGRGYSVEVELSQPGIRARHRAPGRRRDQDRVGARFRLAIHANGARRSGRLCAPSCRSRREQGSCPRRPRRTARRAGHASYPSSRPHARRAVLGGLRQGPRVQPTVPSGALATEGASPPRRSGEARSRRSCRPSRVEERMARGARFGGAVCRIPPSWRDWMSLLQPLAAAFVDPRWCGTRQRARTARHIHPVYWLHFRCAQRISSPHSSSISSGTACQSPSPRFRRAVRNAAAGYLTNFRLRPAMYRTQRCFLASGCSTYCRVRLGAPRVEIPTAHGTSQPSLRNPVRYPG